jgi:hypothetical protein
MRFIAVRTVIGYFTRDRTRIFADHVGSDTNASNFYSGGAGLYFRQGYRLFRLRLFVVIFSPSRHIPWLQCQLFPPPLPPNPFQFIVQALRHEDA